MVYNVDGNPSLIHVIGVCTRTSLKKQWFSVLNFEHEKAVSSTQKSFRARDAVECSNVFLSAGNNPVMLKNSTEHGGTLFIAFRQLPTI